MKTRSLANTFMFVIFLILAVLLTIAVTVFVKSLAVTLGLAFIMWVIWVIYIKKK